MLPVSRYVVDPNDPRLPSQEAWDALSEAERVRIVASLPTEFPVSEAAPPEGDLHYDGGALVREVLRRYFRRGGRRVYVANELPMFYPAEPMFSPDVMVVNDVDTHPRMNWAVSVEGKGIDMALDVGVEGQRLRFFHNLAPLPEASELIARMEAAMDQLVRSQEEAERRAEEESRRAEEESRRAEEESRRAEQSEQRLAEALAELARLKGEKPTP